jgi:cell division septal protein FtsQ
LVFNIYNVQKQFSLLKLKKTHKDIKVRFFFFLLFFLCFFFVLFFIYILYFMLLIIV